MSPPCVDEGVPLRVLVAALTAAPGGSASVLLALLAAWPREDELRCLTWRPEVAEDLQNLGLDVVAIPAHSTPEALVRSATSYRRQLAAWKPDVIYSQQYLLPRQMAPQAVHHQNLLRFERARQSDPLRPLRDWFGADAIRRGDCNIFNSEILLSAAKRRYPKTLNERSVAVVHNPVDPTFLEQARWERVANNLRILVPQGDMPHKRNELAIDVLHQLTQMLDSPRAGTLGMTFAGTGEYRDVLLHARRLGLADRVTVSGYLPKRRFAELYASSAAVLITSSTESFCNPLIEAHAAGVPVVSPPLPVVAEIRGPLSLVANDAHAASLATAVQHAIASRLTEATVEAARAHARAFSPAIKAGEVRDVLLGIANPNR